MPVPAAETPLFLLVFAIALCALGASQLGFGQMHRLKTADLPDWVDQQNR